jgi:hypothetical protein
VDAVDVGRATYIFISRVEIIFVPVTRTPRFAPPPFEYTLIVDPFRELNENEAAVRAPVPDASMPVTTLVPPLEAAELSTVRTQVRSLAVALVVPLKRIPFRV